MATKNTMTRLRVFINGFLESRGARGIFRWSVFSLFAFIYFYFVFLFLFLFLEKYF